MNAPIDVAVIDDPEIEGEETVAVTMTGATGDANLLLGSAEIASMAIADDDQTLNIEQAIALFKQWIDRTLTTSLAYPARYSPL